MIRLDAATVALQWAVGGMAFCWFTTRRQEVGLGYGWLLRGIYLLLAAGGFAAGVAGGVVPVREAASLAVALSCLLGLVVSIGRRRSGVTGFPPALDLVPVALGSVGLVAAALDAGGAPVVALLRTFAGAAFLGAVSDAMLLGHWYLVQPGLPRRLLHELVDAVGWVWPVEVVAMLLPIGMVSVW
nr:hypothetical protein [Acidimicrobiia bacterium]